MNASFNRITLIGTLVRDAEITYVNPSGAPVTRLTLKVVGRSKYEERVDLIDCVAYDKIAEMCNAHFKNGTQCLVDGNLHIRSYEDKNGEKRKAAEVIVESARLISKPQDTAR